MRKEYTRQLPLVHSDFRIPNSEFPEASPMGFEPTISAVTGRRALLAAPRGRILLLFEWLRRDSNPQHPCDQRFASVPEPGWSAVAYRAVVYHECPRQDSNLQSLGFEPSRSASWRTWAVRRRRFRCRRESSGKHFGDYTGTHRLASLSDREATADVNRHRLSEFNRQRHRVAGHGHLGLADQPR